MKNKLKKCLKGALALVVVATSFFEILSVKAETVNDTLYVDTSYTFDVATTKYADPNTWVIGHENPIRRRSDNQPVYCIEAHVHFNDNSNVIGYDDESNQASLSSLSFEDRLKVFNIAYYGYGYGNHTSIEWYAATQLLIWQVTDKNNNPPYPIEQGDRTLTRTNRFDAMFDEINYLVDHDHLTVSFNNQTIEANVGDTITFTDDNEVLSQFFRVEANGVDATIKENKLIIKSDKKFDGTIELVPKTNNKPLIYDGANQKVTSRGDPRKVQGKVKIRFKGGDVELNKKDKDTQTSLAQGEATLSGAAYDIYDAETNEIVSTLTTTENGYVKSGELPSLGRYYAKEKSPSVGYQLDNTKYYFDITRNNLHPNIDVYEKVISLNYDITKVFANDLKTEIMMPEPNVEFGFYNAKGELYKQEITDKNGNIKITLPYGSYIVKQLTTTKDHEKVKDFSLDVRKVGEDVRLVISNAEITARLKVVKIDKKTKKVIKRKGIKFKIFSYSQNDYICQSVTYPNKESICVFETNKDGEFITPNALHSGKYRLEEIDKKIDGYLWNKESKDFEIGDSSKLVTDAETGVVFETKFENQKVYGKVTIDKVGEKVDLVENSGYEFTFEKLEGVKFCVYDSNDKEISCGETDNEGQLSFEQLPLGKYYIKEISTLDGYVLDTSKHEFELKYKDQYTPVVEYKTLIKNFVPTGKLIFTKTDISESKALPNTRIEIFTEDGIKIFSKVTGENGKIVIDKLPVGKYYILEKDAPEGYQLNKKKMFFKIKENGEIVKATMKDEEIVKVPDTLKNESNLILVGGVLLFVIGTGVIIYAKKKKRK